MNRLPKYWVVKNPNQIVKDYLAKTYNVPDVLTWNYNFIGFDGIKSYNGVHGTSCLKYFYNDPAILTLDKFIELSKEVDEFVLPEKWYVEVPNELDSKEIQKYFNTSDYKSNTGIWFYTSDTQVKREENNVPKEYTKITFEQLTKYVLKQDIMEKEIIGYKLKEGCNQYYDAVDTIAKEYSISNYMEIGSYPTVIKRLQEAKVLNLWFEPVYKEEYPNITINGYKGEFFDNYVKFGCAEIGKELFIQINKLILSGFDYGISNKEIESVTIGKGTFTKDQIKQIAEYYLNKNNG